MTAPITIRRLTLSVPTELYADPVVAGHRARMFAHLVSMATPEIESLESTSTRHEIVLVEAGDAAIAELAKRSRR